LITTTASIGSIAICITFTTTSVGIGSIAICITFTTTSVGIGSIGATFTIAVNIGNVAITRTDVDIAAA
jgi:hypothetical protein